MSVRKTNIEETPMLLRRGPAATVATLVLVSCNHALVHLEPEARWLHSGTGRASARMPETAPDAWAISHLAGDRPIRVTAWSDSHGNVRVHRKIVEAMREFDPDLAVFAGDALNCLPLGHMPDIGIAAYAVPAWPQYLRGHPEFSALTILPFPALLHDSVLAPLGPPRDECGFNEFLQTTAPMRLLDGVPLLFAPGNHDTYHKQDIRQIAALFGSPAGVAGTHPERLWFSADAGAWRFVVLYSGTDLAFDADPLAAGGAQLEWLEANLSEADRLGRRVAIAMHCPPFSSAKEDPPSPRLEKRVVRAILDRHRVDLVICGHQHAYERLERRGVTYVITGGAGGRFDEPVAAEDLDPHSEVFATGTHNFLRFEFATGGWTGEAVDVDGRVFDAFGPGIPSTAEIATR